MQRNYKKLEEFTFARGANLFAVADLRLTTGEKIKQSVVDLAPEVIRELDYGISIGVRLSDKVIESLQDHPTKLYLHHYRQVNYLLDRIALGITQLIQKEGRQALPIPASQTIDWEKQRGHLSHKEIARLAGLGWKGRNNLLINPAFGCRIRLVSVLTDFPLTADRPLSQDCGDCHNCLAICPAKAIKERPGDFAQNACIEQLSIFKKKYSLGHYICGLCIKACKGGSNG